MHSFGDEQVTDSVSNYAKKTLRLHSYYTSQPLATQALVIAKSKTAVMVYACLTAAFLAGAASNFSEEKFSPIKSSFYTLGAVACALRGRKRNQERKADELVFETMRQHNPHVVMAMLEGMKNKAFPEQLRQRAPRFY